jgi:hypothetical protein
MSVILVGADGKSIGTLTNYEVQNIMRASRQGSRAGSRWGTTCDWLFLKCAVSAKIGHIQSTHT